MTNHEELDDKLKQYRSGNLEISSLSSWVKDNSNIISTLLSRTAFLKLKQRNPTKALIERLGSGCNCNDIFKEGHFDSRSDYDQCESKINNAKSLGILSNIQEPSWVNSPKGEIGAAGFYCCQSCGGLWKILLPERASSGSWSRIA